MHLERILLVAMFAGKFRRFLPVRNDSLVPLPLEDIRKVGWPAVSGPVRRFVLGRTARAAGKSDDDRDVHPLGEEHGHLQVFRIALSARRIRVNWIPMGAEGSNPNVAVVKLLLPLAGLRRVVE